MPICAQIVENRKFSALSAVKNLSELHAGFRVVDISQ
jgi:hypothetical protein